MSLPSDIPVCDAHFHVWDRNVFYNKNLGEIADGDLGVYTGERYFKEAVADGGLNLAAAVHVETVVGQKPGGFPIDTVDETRYVVEQSKPLSPTPVAIVAYVHLARDDAASVLDAHAAAGGSQLRGVRHIMNFRADGAFTWPQVEHGNYFDGVSADSLAFARGLAVVDARGLSFDTHMNWFQLQPAAAFFAAHAPPTLKIVVDHMGCLKTGAAGDDASDTDETRLAAWEAGMRALAARPNTFVKLSGFEYTFPGWMGRDPAMGKRAAAMVSALLGMFGAGRCMFASNYPVDKFSEPGSDMKQLYGAFWALTEELGLPRDDRLALFAGTATGFYGVDKV